MNWNAFLGETITNLDALAKEIPQTMSGFETMSKAAKTNGALDEKTKELVAIGIAIATRCDSCIGFHAKSLVRLGVSRDELCETLAMAAYMGGGPSLAYGAKALHAFDFFKNAKS